MIGRCFCGGVSFELDGPTSNIELCHCTRCQRATGSAFSAEFRVRAENFRWLGGEELISHCDAPILREPPAYRRSFCSRCGSLVPIDSSHWATMIVPTVGELAVVVDRWRLTHDALAFDLAVRIAAPGADPVVGPRDHVRVPLPQTEKLVANVSQGSPHVWR